MFVGSWDLDSMYMVGKSTGPSELATLRNLGLYVTFKVRTNMTATLDLFGERTNGTWRDRGSGHGTVTMEGQDVAMRYSGGKLTLEQDGAKLVFRRR